MKLVIAVAMVAMTFAVSAHAQLFRAYVSTAGSDANPCTLTAPCRLLPSALNAVADGGEVWMLDSGNFNVGTVTIGKSVSILAVPGAVGSVVAINGSAFSVSAPGLEVALRNLMIAPFPGTTGGSVYGVSLTAASSVILENTVLANLPSDAVYVAGGGRLDVNDSTLRGSSGFAIRATGGATVQVTNSRLLANTLGALAVIGGDLNTFATVTRSTLSGIGQINNSTSGDTGVYAAAPGFGAALVHMSQNTVTGFYKCLALSKTGNANVELVLAGSVLANCWFAWHNPQNQYFYSGGQNTLRWYNDVLGAGFQSTSGF